MPFSGLGTTPGGAPSGKPEAMVCRACVVQVDGDQRLGAGVDDIQLPPAHQNALRPRKSSTTVWTPDPVKS